MSQNFKDKIYEMKDNDVTGDEPPQQEPPQDDTAATLVDRYPSHSHARNLCLEWKDGRMMFLNYSYLVSCDYKPKDNSVTMTFTSHIVVMKGVQLEALFKDLMLHLPKVIASKDERYNALAEEKEPIVNDITIEEK